MRESPEAWWKSVERTIVQALQRPVPDADAAWKLQAELQPQVFGSEDAKEGATAFIERRDPVWKGR